MGTGTSFGVPVVACNCHVCKSQDPKDKRLRCSILIEQEEANNTKTTLLVDVSPEFRLQALKYGITSLTSVFITHSHADHLHGLDDLRVFSHKRSAASVLHKELSIAHKNAHKDQSAFPEAQGAGLHVYAASNTIQDIKTRFSYIFAPYIEGGGIPKLALTDLDSFDNKEGLLFGSVRVFPLPLMHGSLKDNGYLFCVDKAEVTYSFAYLTDCNYIAPEVISFIKEKGGVIKHCVIDALRKAQHSTHLSFDEAASYARKIGAEHTWFTHICHDATHEEITQYSLTTYGKDANILPAYDGQVLYV